MHGTCWAQLLISSATAMSWLHSAVLCGINGPRPTEGEWRETSVESVSLLPVPSPSPHAITPSSAFLARQHIPNGP
eukprot:802200-Pleurochrysis_carterae.AAC.2